MLHTGIDLHKRTCVLATVDDDGERIAEAELRCHRPTLVRYFAALPEPHAATVETTSGWYWLADLLATEGVTLSLAHAKFLKAIAYAKVKTDAVDAGTLAQLLRVGLIPEAHMIAPELRPLRDVMRTRLRLTQKEVGAKNSIERLFEEHNVRSVADLPEFAQLQPACHQEQVELLRSQIRTLEKSLHPHLVPDPDVQRLLTIPGIGKIGAFTLVLEIDGIERFPTERHFFSYCRLVPGAANSAGRDRHRRSKGREQIPEDRLHQRRRPGHPVLPRDPGMVHPQSAQEEPARCPGPGRKGDRSNRLSPPLQAGGLQPSLQGHPAAAAQTDDVAASVKPGQLTGSVSGPSSARLIGKADAMPPDVSGTAP